MSFEAMIMSKQLRFLVWPKLCIVALVGFAAPAPALAAALRVVTSTTDLAWAARQIGGDEVVVESLLRGHEDPHFVDARPDFVSKVSRADAVCIVGLDLEIGWMPKVLAKSGRREIQPGGKGYCNAGEAIEPLDKSTGPVDRSMGDVHPSGNPHYWLSPVSFATAASEVRSVLVRLDPKNTSLYEERYKEFVASMETLRKSLADRLVAAGVSARSAGFFEYHREFAYFAQAYGLTSLGAIEEKPGVSPSAKRLVQVSQLIRDRGVRLVLAGHTAPQRTLAKVQELSGVPVVRLPLSVAREGSASDYVAWQSHLVDEIIKAHRAAAPRPSQP
jgi:zinc/manganese transport system substrate-binding protein